MTHETAAYRVVCETQFCEWSSDVLDTREQALQSGKDHCDDWHRGGGETRAIKASSDGAS